MPYLSRDTTYCYQHCKGILHFPLLPYHSTPRPMPDRIASASLIIRPHHATLIGLMPRNPITCTASQTASFLDISIPFPPWRHYDIWLRPRLRPRLRPYPSHDIIAYRSSTIRPLPLTLTIRMAIRYWLIPLAWWTFPLSLTYCTMLWLTWAYAADWYSPTPWRRRRLTLTYNNSFLGSFY